MYHFSLFMSSGVFNLSIVAQTDIFNIFIAELSESASGEKSWTLENGNKVHKREESTHIYVKYVICALLCSSCVGGGGREK
jgi:hypothetical protein